MGTKSITLNISGMSCAACAQRIEKVLSKHEGIESSVVNLLAEKATIEYYEDKISLEDIVKTIEKTG
ncbi:heavy-metal-associated domain-containing protein, partial [Anaerosalibacter bizertensis]|nr:heavy-metal-associated domain-containing protein [Anaerosalibacter bizertensis]